MYWHHTLQTYSAESSLIKPLLHTWTLAIEEQFYLIFPLLFFTLYRYCKNYIIYIFVAIGLCRLIFAVWMTKYDLSFSFYGLYSRFWELLSGGMLAWFHVRHISDNKTIHWFSFLPLLGIIFIVGSFLIIDESYQHPGLITMIPVAGTIMILASSKSNQFVTNILSSKVLTQVGLWSYSLYLWHYPIYAFGRLINPEVGVIDYSINI